MLARIYRIYPYEYSASLCVYVTGFGKSLFPRTKYFITQDNIATLKTYPYTVSLSIVTELVCFSGGQFADTVMSQLRVAPLEYTIWGTMT